METVREVLKRFNLSLDLTPELLSIEVEGGYNRYEVEEYDNEDNENIDDAIKYIFISDYSFEYIALLVICVSDENCSVGDFIQPDYDKPGMGSIYLSDGTVLDT